LCVFFEEIITRTETNIKGIFVESIQSTERHDFSFFEKIYTKNTRPKGILLVEIQHGGSFLENFSTFCPSILLATATKNGDSIELLKKTDNFDFFPNTA
jgi:hypothetical protein